LSSLKVVGIHKITGAAFPGRKAAGAWGWTLTPV